MAIQRLVSAQTTGGAHQRMDVWLDKGAAIQVLEGAALLAMPPEWLAEQVVWTRVTLRAGDRHVARRAGWVVLAASGEGLRLVCEPARPMRVRAGRWAARLRDALRLLVSATGAMEKARARRA
jgi:hypothetical protein